MYAKLVFNSGTSNALAVRDIVRAIVNSDGAGGSTLGALENVDVANSSINDTVASGWSLAAGQSISTGAAVEQDKAFYLQAAHQNTSTKTARLGTSFRDASGFTKAEDATYGGVIVGPVLDYGETYQSDVGFPSDSSAANSSTAHRCRVNTDKTIYVIADAKRIIILGETTGFSPGGKYHGLIELDPSHENTVGRNRPAQVYVNGSSQRTATNAGYASASDLAFANYTTANHFSSSYNQIIHQVFVDAFYDYGFSEEVRIAAVSSAQTMTTPSAPSGVTPSSDFELVTIMRDTGNADGYGAESLNSSRTYNCFLGGQVGEGWPGLTASSLCGWYGFFREYAYTTDSLHSRDTAGNRANKLHALAVMAGFGLDQHNYTLNGGMYRGTDYFAGENIEITDGADIYLGSRVGHSYGSQGAVWFKAV